MDQYPFPDFSKPPPPLGMVISIDQMRQRIIYAVNPLHSSNYQFRGPQPAGWFSTRETQSTMPQRGYFYGDAAVPPLPDNTAYQGLHLPYNRNESAGDGPVGMPMAPQGPLAFGNSGRAPVQAISAPYERYPPSHQNEMGAYGQAPLMPKTPPMNPYYLPYEGQHPGTYGPAPIICMPQGVLRPEIVNETMEPVAPHERYFLRKRPTPQQPSTSFNSVRPQNRVLSDNSKKAKRVVMEEENGDEEGSDLEETATAPQVEWAAIPSTSKEKGKKSCLVSFVSQSDNSKKAKRVVMEEENGDEEGSDLEETATAPQVEWAAVPSTSKGKGEKSASRKCDKVSAEIEELFNNEPSTSEDMKNVAKNLQKVKPSPRRRLSPIKKRQLTKNNQFDEDSEDEEAVDDPEPKGASKFLGHDEDVQIIENDSILVDSDDSDSLPDITLLTSQKEEAGDDSTNEYECSINFERLTFMPELLQCLPCHCARACMEHAAPWVAENKRCYFCGSAIENAEVVPYLKL